MNNLLKNFSRPGGKITVFMMMVCWILASPRSVLSAGAELTRVPDTDPETERRSFQVADGFEVNLFAADPLLGKPVEMNFDPAGRLWVACTEVYPQIKPGQQPNDKIVILEDTKGVGRADKATLFADGLLIPTGVVPGDGGAYVGQGTELLHLADTKGQGRVDQRRVVLSGFGTEDTHHLVHTLRWGPDGMLYFNQSIYIHSHIETPYGVRHLNGGGIWQYRPETGQLEVLARGFWNPWGNAYDRWGQSFVTDGAFGEGIDPLVPGASYPGAIGTARTLHGLTLGSPKYCGAEILTGRHLPDDWQGNVLTNDFRAHRVCRFVLREDGSGYAAQEKGELIKTDFVAFRPVDVKMGPDGAIYVADWYNPIINHGEVDFRDPRRDHNHGRIWRITAKGRPLVPRPLLASASNEGLLEALKAPEDWTRLQAKRVLKERGSKVLPEVADWIQNLNPADGGHEHHLLEALWTYQALDVVEAKLLTSLLHARDHHVRAAAVRVLAAWSGRIENPLALLAERVHDDHPQVRLEAIRGLAQVSQPRAVEAALEVLDKPMDPVLDYALWLTVRDLQPTWMPALAKGQLTFGGKARHLVFALQAVDSPQTVGLLVDLVRQGKVSGDQEENVLQLLTSLGQAPELGIVFERALDPKLNIAEKTRLLEALVQAAQDRGIRPAGDLSQVSQLLGAEDQGLQAAAARLVGLWKIESLRSKLIEIASAAGSNDLVCRAAVDGLVYLAGQASLQELEELAGANHPFGLRQKAVVALVRLDVRTAARRAVELLAAFKDGEDSADLFDAFLQQKMGPEELTHALAASHLSADVAKVGIRLLRMSGKEQPRLLDALTRAGNLTTVRKVLNPKEMQELVAEVQQKGDPARGEMVFRRKDQSCQKCHAIAGAGGQVGPDLASIGSSAPVDYLIDSILLPNKAIKENYHALVVTTVQGRVFTGIKVRETSKELVLRGADDHDIVIPLKEIDETSMGGSLMPDGITDTLTHTEFIDLVRFLAELGKVGPYAVSKAPLVRKWQVLEATDQTNQLIQRVGLASVVGDKSAFSWEPAFSQVSGLLPLAAIPRLKPGQDGGQIGVFRCQLETSSAGKAKFLLNSVTGLRLWMDGIPFEVSEQMILDLGAGSHLLTAVVDFRRRQEGILCELADFPGSAARVQLVGAK